MHHVSNLHSIQNTDQTWDDSPFLPDRPVSDSTILVSEEDLLELQIIAQHIGGDLGLEVHIGTPHQGSYFSFDPPSITLDPVHILSDPEFAKFVAGHEGAHRRFSISPNEMLPSTVVEELYQQPGFHATMNTIEDCAVNDGMSREIPGMAKYTTTIYEKCDQKGLHISTPEIQQIVQITGREPKYARALAEITKDWHRWRKVQGYTIPFKYLARSEKYDADQDPAILSALQESRKSVKDAISCMPSVGERDAARIWQCAFNRHELVRHYVYPEIKKLVEQDLKIEAIRQELNKDSQGNSSNSSGGSGSAMAKKLSQRARDEVKKSIDEYIQDQIAQRYEQFQELQEQLSELTSDSQSSTPANLGTDLQIEQLLKELDQQFPELKDENTASQDQDQTIAKIGEAIQQKLEESGETPLPFEKLPEDVQQELTETFEKLPKKTKAAALDNAQKALNEFDHELAQALRQKMEESPIPTAHERTQSKDNAAPSRPSLDDQVKTLGGLQQHLENERIAQLGIFDKTYEEIATDVHAAFNRLQRILIPQACFQWEKDHLQGARLNLQRALQSEADPRYLTKLFERRQDPIHRTHCFEILVDTSGSMSGLKSQTTFKGVVYLSSLLEQLGVEFEIIEFSGSSTTRKTWHESIKNTDTRSEIERVSTSSGGGTNDAAALTLAEQRIREKDSMYKFIIVLTDAESGTSSELRRILKKIGDQHEIVVLHFGLGKGTQDTQGYYQHSFGDLDPNQFFTKFCEVVEETILHPELYLDQGGTSS